MQRAHLLGFETAGAHGFVHTGTDLLQLGKVTQDHAQLETVLKALGETALLALERAWLDACDAVQQGHERLEGLAG